jgi:hypothetical protein
MKLLTLTATLALLLFRSDNAVAQVGDAVEGGLSKNGSGTWTYSTYDEEHPEFGGLVQSPVNWEFIEAQQNDSEDRTAEADRTGFESDPLLNEEQLLLVRRKRARVSGNCDKKKLSGTIRGGAAAAKCGNLQGRRDK